MDEKARSRIRAWETLAELTAQRYWNRLTTQDQRYCIYLATGASEETISQILFLSPKTLKNKRIVMSRRMGKRFKKGAKRTIATFLASLVLRLARWDYQIQDQLERARASVAEFERGIHQAEGNRSCVT